MSWSLDFLPISRSNEKASISIVSNREKVRMSRSLNFLPISKSNEKVSISTSRRILNFDFRSFRMLEIEQCREA